MPIASANRPLDICLFIRSLDVGGSQRQVGYLAAGLKERGHSVTVATFYPGGAVEAALGERGVRVVTLAKQSRWDLAGPLARLRRLWSASPPDAVYAFLPMQATLAALLLPRNGKTRLVFGIRSAGIQGEHYDWLSSFSYRTEAWLSRRAGLIIANSVAGRDSAIARGMPADRIAVIPNGIDTALLRPDPAAGLALRRAWKLAPEHFVIGMMARLDPMKDHANFLKAAGLFAHDQGDARFVVVGGGAPRYRAELQALAERLGIADRVTFAGERSDVSAVYSAFDIAVLSSSFGEGFPNVIGEAMACGTPVVATDIGDARAVVGRLGEIVPPRDPAALAQGFARMRMRLAREGAALAAQSRARIETEFSVEAMVQATEAALARLVGR